MKILVCHNFYQQPGGEDQVFAAEVDLLRRCGHDVLTVELDNDAIGAMSRPAAAMTTLWSRAGYERVRDATAAHRAEVVHFHNTFPLISPAAYYGAHEAGAAVVQTLHNFRLLCPGANLFREGKPCERCAGKPLAIEGIMHGCYRGSRSASAAVALMVAGHHLLGTWRREVDAYLAPTPFVRDRFIEAGWDASRILVKPNFLDPDPGPGDGAGGFALFVARLSSEKGLDTLLAAWETLGSQLPLRIIGDGPLARPVVEATRRNRAIQWLGRQPLAQVLQTIGQAKMLIFPSNCYETFGRVAVEAYARGTPVIASRHGAPGDVVIDGKTGLLFEPGNAAALASAVDGLGGDPALLRQMRSNCREEYLARYTGQINHQQLLAAYQQAIERGENHRRRARQKSPAVAA